VKNRSELLKNLPWDVVIITDPHEKQQIVDEVFDDFLVVRWEDKNAEYYAGRSVVMRTCRPFITQVWQGTGQFPYPESDVRLI
jgi:hypothetical protein